MSAVISYHRVREILVFLVFRDEFKGSGLNLKLHLIPADLSSLKNGSASDSVLIGRENIGSSFERRRICKRRDHNTADAPTTHYLLYPPPAINRLPSRL